MEVKKKRRYEINCALDIPAVPCCDKKGKSCTGSPPELKIDDCGEIACAPKGEKKEKKKNSLQSYWG